MLIISALRFLQLGKFNREPIYPNKFSKNNRKLVVVVPILRAVVFLNFPKPLCE